ncbi:hypothetical protein CHS0354_005867 [Potamilus streckersoni]|uniref:Uncharacterized protein n=1 Tax=Potamilus streckersoni TaxID=2493646 RepID=A0AAE0T824_9BIVA|nr:hypothetical protein CHS0354_005867 [Potamilus streckersoni]
MHCKRVNLIVGLLAVICLTLQCMILIHNENYVTRGQQPVTNATISEVQTNVIKQGASYSDDLLIRMSDSESLVYSVPNLGKRFLTIGIPTIRRQNNTYIFETLTSIFNKTAEEDLRDIVFVVFLADFNTEWKTSMAKYLYERFHIYIERGVLCIINAPSSFYPKLDNLKSTYGDSQDKVKWRSKQNVDYAYLMRFSKNLSEFYMQLEDDVVASEGYYNAIKKYIAEQKDDWICLEFSELGFIGKLYHSRDLENLSRLILLFYQEQPVDYIFVYFNVLMAQASRRIHKPTLFQHIGIESSLPGKIQPLKDRFVGFRKKKYMGDNPPAHLFTTMRTNPDFPVEAPYLKSPGYFWSHDNLKENDTVTIVFDNPQSIYRAVVETGAEEYPTDMIYNGELNACISLDFMDSTSAKCSNYVTLGRFVDGKIDANNISSKMGEFKTKCIVIRVTKSQPFWAIIEEIAIFTR